MRNVFAILAAVMLIAGAAVPSVGYSTDRFGNKGQIELGGTLGFTSNTRVVAGSTGDAATTINLQPFVGYFIVDALELGVNLRLNSTTSKGNTTSDYTFLFSPAWNFRIQNSTVTPAIAALIGYGSSTTGGSSYSGLSAGGRATLKILVLSNVNLHIGGEYLMNTRNASGYSGSRNGDNVLSFEAGFAIFFN